jgi:hypothetical protein
MDRSKFGRCVFLGQGSLFWRWMVASRRERCRRMVPLQVCLPLVASHHLVPLKSSRTTTSSVTQTTSRLLTFIIRMTFDLILCRLDPKHRRKNVGPEKITAPHNQHCASDQKNQKLAPLVHSRPPQKLKASSGIEPKPDWIAGVRLTTKGPGISPPSNAKSNLGPLRRPTHTRQRTCRALSLRRTLSPPRKARRATRG